MSDISKITSHPMFGKNPQHTINFLKNYRGLFSTWKYLWKGIQCWKENPHEKPLVAPLQVFHLHFLSFFVSEYLAITIVTKYSSTFFMIIFQIKDIHSSYLFWHFYTCLVWELLLLPQGAHKYPKSAMVTDFREQPPTRREGRKKKEALHWGGSDPKWVERDNHWSPFVSLAILFYVSLEMDWHTKWTG